MGRQIVLAAVVAGALMPMVLGVGCGNSSASLFNPAFINTVSGGAFPLTPGPGADFVMVRCVNETGQNAEFIVTIERNVVERDEDGDILTDDAGIAVTRPQRETVRLNTQIVAPANEAGVLFPCSESAINVVGLGKNLLPSDAAVFVGGTGGTPGFGVSAATVNPLSRLEDPSNFVCGDTVIFRAFRSQGVAGGVKLQSYLLPGAEQPTGFSGPSTFVSYQNFLESQIREDE
ncbi:MAG: hypothetical protein KJ749_12150 [Planctomycetes bacterium]|nr:hypothetical protein [Planctomycetota bacterium]